MSATPLRLGVFGATGRLGARVVAAAQASPEWVVARALGRTVSDAEPRAHAFADCDVVVDVALPEATDALLERLGSSGVPLVTGVTGRTPAQRAALDAYATRAAVLSASNFSVGVALLRHLTELAARAVDWDAEVFEVHHRRKADAPSGTAWTLGEAVAQGRGLPWPDAARAPRESGARGGDEVGLSAARGGDVVGEHTVFFFGEAERIELTHRANDRGVFALGALRAARFLVGQPPGHFSMRDVVRLSMPGALDVIG